jgi:hypothetical protein
MYHPKLTYADVLDVIRGRRIKKSDELIAQNLSFKPPELRELQSMIRGFDIIHIGDVRARRYETNDVGSITMWTNDVQVDYGVLYYFDAALVAWTTSRLSFNRRFISKTIADMINVWIGG